MEGGKQARCTSTKVQQHLSVRAHEPDRMSVFERQRRFAAGAQALLERRQQAGRRGRKDGAALEEGGGGACRCGPEVLPVPSLRSVGALFRLISWL